MFFEDTGRDRLFVCTSNKVLVLFIHTDWKKTFAEISMNFHRLFGHLIEEKALLKICNSENNEIHNSNKYIEE